MLLLFFVNKKGGVDSGGGVTRGRYVVFAGVLVESIKKRGGHYCFV